MDRKSGIGQFLVWQLCFVLILGVVSLFSGCEEEMAGNPDQATIPEMTGTTEIAEATEISEIPFQEPKTDEIEVALETPEESETGFDSETYYGSETNWEPVEAVAVVETPESVEAIPIEPVEPVDPVEPVKLPTVSIAEDIGLKDPVPVESVEMINPETQPEANVDNMYLSTVSYLGDKGQGPVELSKSESTLSEGELLPVGIDKAEGEVESEKAADATESEGVSKKFFPRVGGAITGFARDHYLITGAAIILICIVAARRKRIFGSGLFRRKRHA